MASTEWSLLAILVAFIAQAKCESTAFPVIPKYLLECYMDEGMYHRDNRISNSFESFVDLLKKVEDGPTSKNMNARELSLALLQYLKLDGIQSLQGHAKYFTSNIIPFAPSGAEYFKHRLTLVGLLPRIDEGYMTAFNETLTKQDMCNLHFMLSYSIDPYKRRDEKCSPLFEEFRRKDSPESRSDWNVGEYYPRYRRHVDHGDRLNGVKERRRETGEQPHEILNKRNGMISGSGKLLERRRRHEKDRKLEVEEIPVHENAKGKVPLEEKDKFTIGTQELLSDGERHREAGLQSLVQMRTFGKYGGRFFGSPAQASEESAVSGIIPGLPLSDCPVVNGVIISPFGSLTIGTVIAGIAAGLNPEDIPPSKLSVDPAELESRTDRVKNIWATTLAGTVADALSSTALMEDSLQILKGGWNDSSDPKWYLLSNSDFKHLPEVTLRGSLDGFFLGVNAKEWTDKFPAFKLSQLLLTYYDSVWNDVGARNRVQLLSKYVPEETFRKQTHLMSLVMKKQKTQALTVLNYGPIVKSAVSKVMRHLVSMDEKEKSYIGSFSSIGQRIDNSINMIAVIDSSWGHNNLFKIFQLLRHAQVASTVGSNLTVVCGKDGRVLLTSDNSVVLYNLFTKDMLIENCTRGLDLPLIFDKLDAMYRQIFHYEKTSNKMITASNVVVLFPYEPLVQENIYLTEKSKNFASNFPDVRLMVASSGRAESFRPLVKDPKDLFSITIGTPSADSDLKSVKVFAEGVKQSYHRLSRPSCGSYFSDESPNGDTQVTRDVPPGKVAYYRLLPQYFYTQHDKVTLTIRSKHRVPLTVCHSREERPVGPAPRWPGQGGTGTDYIPNRNPDYAPDRFPEYRPDFPPEASPYGKQTDGEEEEGKATCKTITSETYNIEMKDPCQGASNLQECNPLYISLSPPLQDSVKVICPTCRLPTNVQYEIAITGLTCYNSAAVKFLSPILFCLLLIRYLL